jgi:DNA-binding transcriptional LysR family regulator
VTRPTSIRDSAYAHSTNPVAEGAGVTLVPRLAARYVPAGVRLIQPAEPVTRQIFTVSRRGGDRKPAVRVVLDALSAGISAGVTGECGPGRE